MLTREQALDELLRIEIQLHDLHNRRKDLRQIVLAQRYEYSAAHKTQSNGGPHPPRSHATGSVLRVVKDYEKPITLRELTQLMNGRATHGAVDQTMRRLERRGLVICDRSDFPRLWSLAIHADKEAARLEDQSSSHDAE